MIPIVTSFSPNPKDVEWQWRCVESWIGQGFDLFAIQGQGESLPDSLANRLSHQYRTTVRFTDEPGPPRVAHLLRNAATIEGAIILNSDICMQPGCFDAIQEWQRMTWGETGCLWLRRWNLVEGEPLANASREQWGIDAFAVRPSTPLLEFFDRLDLRIGRPGWDYVLPYWFLLRGLPLWTIDDPPLLLHREHPIRWSQNSWEKNTIAGATALGIAPTVQLQQLSQQLNADIDRYSKRLALSWGGVGKFDSTG
jgi:hypothetical protein